MVNNIMLPTFIFRWSVENINSDCRISLARRPSSNSNSDSCLLLPFKNIICGNVIINYTLRASINLMTNLKSLCFMGCDYVHLL